MQKVVIYTDGACEGNPGPGGWAALLMSGSHRKEISGGEAATTNNRMELRASIAALAVLKEPCQVELHTDSQYLRDGVTRWLAGWKRNGWRTREKKPVKNADLWRELEACTLRHTINWCWVRGHSGDEHNERCDQLAVAEVARLRGSHSPGELRRLLEVFRDEQNAPAAAALLL